ncbi:putative late blight resistance protein homolog R1A-3 [Primulina eburnea]|uniref:putative late blight resistance protein homolog R1A-3 n=1 Tax=Primulina eburnea TaxID=1245227 RepID=UPI003C6CB276
MAHLRHVRCDEAHLLDPSAAKYDICRKTLVLEELQTLSRLWNLVFTEELLQKIPNIKKIDVEYESDYLNKWSDYQLENLGNLHQLKTLKICVLPCLGVLVNLFNPSRFKFHFPTSLKTLILGGVGIPWHDLAIIGSLPNLEVLKLINCACLGTVWEPNEGEFCELKVLVLERLKLNHWEADHNHFPCLQRLVIRWCYGLVKIPSGMGDSPTLNMIELRGCKDSVFASANEIVEKQRSYGNDDFQVIVNDKKKARQYKSCYSGVLGAAINLRVRVDHRRILDLPCGWRHNEYLHQLTIFNYFHSSLCANFHQTLSGTHQNPSTSAPAKHPSHALALPPPR